MIVLVANRCAALPAFTHKGAIMSNTATPSTPDPQQDELARGTPPAQIPETAPETDIEPDQQPVRDTPDLESPGGEA
jgi:hypothetical protein